MIDLNKKGTKIVAIMSSDLVGITKDKVYEVIEYNEIGGFVSIRNDYGSEVRTYETLFDIKEKHLRLLV